MNIIQNTSAYDIQTRMGVEVALYSTNVSFNTIQKVIVVKIIIRRSIDEYICTNYKSDNVFMRTVLYGNYTYAYI